MKLKPLDQYIDFIEAVQTCVADVYFCSDEGDRLNLKSTLSQFLFASICGDRDYLRGGPSCARTAPTITGSLPILRKAKTKGEQKMKAEPTNPEELMRKETIQ